MVVDATGQPVANAHVSVETDRWRRTYRGEADSEGKFVLQAIFQESAKLTVSEFMVGPKQVVQVDVQEGQPLRIVLQTYAKMEGYLISPKPEAGFQYSVRVVHPDPEQRIVRPPVSWADKESGRYEVVGVISGRRLVQVMHWSVVIYEIPDVLFEEGMVCSDSRVREIDLNEYLDRWTIKIIGPGAGGPFFANCLVSGEAGDMGVVTTDPNGLASFVLPKGGEWTLTVTSRGMEPEEVTLSGEPASEPLIVQMKPGIQVRLICQQAPAVEREGRRAQLSLGLLNPDGEISENGPSVYLSESLISTGEGLLSFPKPGNYVLLLATHKIPSPGGMIVGSVASRCTFSDFILEVKESDEGKTLDLVLPGDLFQGQ
ncbi:MAG: carboxypeptidase regulatory-like domain-containing protein [Planctomycetes bacterium]|nr:carboxypeptidase regulatory-like domain-containing protein [Planctomycetota bacterium]